MQPTIESRRVMLLLLAAGVSVLGATCGGGGGGGGGGPTDPGPVAATATVELFDNSYSPRSVTVNPGDTVSWVLRGNDRTHTVTAIDGAFDSGAVFNQPGATFRRTFNEAGRTFEIRCAAHADCCNMRGSVRVGSS